ncbi:hypothetical protein IDM40_00635 [Nocardiopsis sp. HNM0947]|uniref:Uncharacterized protein n=1 Tax=Nocardiopsis coralli TaxID=2772213 RepID=A0ABR9P057_9ACTN|nr:hypothetical protein [Nocardiopsis coralli]MBE2997212.1 hypothetical protein [Nocardiopsis coralli]
MNVNRATVSCWTQVLDLCSALTLHEQITDPDAGKVRARPGPLACFHPAEAPSEAVEQFVQPCAPR